MLRLLGMLACFALAGTLLGGAEAKKKKKADDPVSLEELSKMLRPLLVQAMPKVLYEDETNWGKQRPTAHAIHWRGLRPKIVKEPRNDGTWRKLKVTADNLDKTLEFKLWGLKKLDAERQTFKCFVSFRTGVHFDQQIWESGIRLHSGSTRAHLQIRALMDVENTIRTEPTKSFIPDVVFRLRVTDAKVWYKDLEFERVAGIGGDAAPILGEALHDALDHFRPKLEKDLLKKASTAIVKAADTKEVRISLGSLFGGK